ncbi:HlyD family secretion protein [Pseudoduganella sp. R-34]|uniref:HlyD family secretion protein n=1 Tax=unclassified Pseudoduganella TaxID=2637179 RepID=UPI003CF936D4
MSELFRREAYAARRPKWLGEIIVIQPPSARLVSALVACVLVGLVLLLSLGTYTRRTTVSGKLVPVGGLIQVAANQAGVVLERRFAEGDTLRAGQIMYVISSERQNGALAPTRQTAAHELQSRSDSLQHELSLKAEYLQDQERRTVLHLRTLREELAKLDEQLASQSKLLTLEQGSHQRFQDLHERGYVSDESFKQKQSELLEHRNRLAALQRERLEVERNINERQDDLATARLRHASDAEALRRQLSSNKQELSENELQLTELIVAPRDGVATAILADTGQAVGAGSTLASLLPQASRMQARLYAPSNAIGFVRPNARVLLRYDAYPYQHFGQAGGNVVSVTQAPAVVGTAVSAANGGIGTPQYEIIVELDQQDIQVAGQMRKLPAGMNLQADVLSETRSLYQWMFMPFRELNALVGATKP